MSKLWWVKQDQLDDVQLEIVEQAGRGRGFVLNGPPGSGKTNLLMLSAAKMKTRGYENTKVVVFTRTLCNFIAKGLNTYKLASDSVDTLTNVAYQIQRDHGDTLPNSSSFAERRDGWRGNFQKYITNNSHIDRVFDSLLIDESQDFNQEEVTTLFGCTRYAAFAIDINQSIYERSDNSHPVYALQVREELPIFNLECHYRVGRRICKFADLVMEGRNGYQPIEDSSMYSEDERASLVSLEISSSDTFEEWEKIIGRATNQLLIYPGERIGVLFPTNVQITQFKDYCAGHHPKFLEYQEPDEDGIRADLLILSMHDAKGLEFAVVHLAGQEKLSSFKTQRNLLFTSVTRARYACYITASGKVPEYLTSAYKRLDGPIPFIESQLFPE